MSFHFTLWLFLTVENWLFDFGRPIYALYASDLFPLSLPSIGDYCHMAYNVATALCVLQLLDKCSRPVPKYLQVKNLWHNVIVRKNWYCRVNSMFSSLF